MFGKKSTVKAPTGSEAFAAATKALQPAIKNEQQGKKELAALEKQLINERGNLESLQRSGEQLESTLSGKAGDQNAFAKLRTAISRGATETATSVSLIDLLGRKVALAKQSYRDREDELESSLVAEMDVARQAVESEMTEHLGKAVDLHDEYMTKLDELCGSLKVGAFDSHDSNLITPTLRHERIAAGWQEEPKGTGFTAVLPLEEYEREVRLHGLDEPKAPGEPAKPEVVPLMPEGEHNASSEMEAQMEAARPEYTRPTHAINDFGLE